VIQLLLFDVDLSEVILKDGKRYILKRNPVRAKEISENRLLKLSQLHKIISERNNDLTEHQRANPNKALNYCSNKLRRLKLDGWIELQLLESKRKN
jgi:hypothetical protein